MFFRAIALLGFVNLGSFLKKYKFPTLENRLSDPWNLVSNPQGSGNRCARVWPFWKKWNLFHKRIFSFWQSYNLFLRANARWSREQKQCWAHSGTEM